MTLNSINLRRFPATTIARLFACILAGCAEVAAARAQSPAISGHALPSLQQIVRHFDFEEPDAAPNSLPFQFYRYIAPSQGFPPFGIMRLTSETAHAGAGSFEFELGGGSMSARLPTAAIPILPLTDYSVTCWVKTDGLTHAHARLVAWLHDKSGNVIGSSISRSEAVQTQGEWQRVGVEVRGRDPNAADLVLDLQVVQREPRDEQATARETPRLQDITGRAWFDDVVVSHLPHVMVSMPGTGSIVQLPGVPELEILVSELTREALTARLQIFNIDGEAVFDSSFPAPRGMASTIRAPIDRCGWYRALLEVTSGSGISRLQTLDFAIVPPRAGSVTSSNRFGVVVGDLPTSHMPLVPALIDELGCRNAVVSIWDRETGTRRNDPRGAARRDLIERLLRDNVELVFALDRVPEHLARSAGVEPHQVLDLLAKEPHHWQAFLDDLLVNFGLEVARWQLGTTDRAEAFWINGLREKISAAQRSFSDYVPRPVLLPTWSLDQGFSSADQLAACAVTVPYHVAPAALLEYAESMGIDRMTATALLDPLPASEYTARQCVTDMMIRALYAWRAGFSSVFVRAPWRLAEDPFQGRSFNGHETLAAPEPLFAAWRQLARRLADAEFIGELTLESGSHLWMLRGRRTGESVLVVWSDRVRPPDFGSADDSTIIPIQLANGPVILDDAFGNSQVIQPVNGLHPIPVSEMPAFIRRADLNLVQFRGNVTVEPGFLPAVSKVHELQIVLRNPWDVTVSGSIRFAPYHEWQLAPSTLEFTIPSGGETRLPLNMIPQRSILAGDKSLNAAITLSADQPYTMTVLLPLKVGLENIDLTPTWTMERNRETGGNDLIITQAVTNHGKSPVHLDVYLLADGIGQMRRTIAGLGPGETAVRTFRIADGARTLAGQQVRVGVAERDGLTRLNQLLTIAPGNTLPMAQVPAH